MSKPSKPQTTSESEKKVDTPTSQAATSANHDLSVRARAAMERMRAAGPTPRFELTESGMLSPDDPDEGAGAALLAEAFGTTNYDFYRGSVAQLAAASEIAGKVDMGRFHYLVAAATGFKPRDQVEAMFSTLASVFHSAAMSQVQDLLTFDEKDFGGLDARQRAKHMLVSDASRLGLTCMAMIDGLMRYRARIDGLTQPERRPPSEVSQTSSPPLARSEAPPIPTVERPAPAAASRRRKVRKLNGHSRP
jgi:hypothetical protein